MSPPALSHEELDPYAERILAAARRLLLEFGLKRTPLADIARAADVSEATLYRRFASRDELLRQLVTREVRAFIAQMDQSAGAIEDPAESLAQGFVFFMRSLAREELAARLIQTDPEVVLPMITTHGGPWLTVARDYVVEQMEKAVERHDVEFNGDPAQLAEVMVRLSHSLILTPETNLPVGDDDELAEFARNVLVPMVLSEPKVRR